MLPALACQKRCVCNKLYSLTRWQTAKKVSRILYFARWCRRLNARRYVRNRLLNNFLRRLLTSSVHFSSPQKAMWLFGDPLGTAPEQKTKSAKTAQLCGFSAFSVVFYITTIFTMCFIAGKRFFYPVLYDARSGRLFRQSKAGSSLLPAFILCAAAFLVRGRFLTGKMVFCTAGRPVQNKCIFFHRFLNILYLQQRFDVL